MPNTNALFYGDNLQVLHNYLPHGKDKAMHKIEITHRFFEISRTERNPDIVNSTDCCLDCGQKRQSLHLRSRGDTAPNNVLIRDATLPDLEHISALWRQFSVQTRKMFDLLPEGTKFKSTEAILADIEKRYNGIVSSQDVPFGELLDWTRATTKKFQAKILLAYRQGLVCNRCDSVCRFDELEIDHVIPDRSFGQLTNLQLLCISCHSSKQDRPPSEKDVSPFKHEGEVCQHHLTCGEWSDLFGTEN